MAVLTLPHYENLPMQYTEIFSFVIIEDFSGKVRIFLFFFFLLKTEIVDTR